ncbi:hypothetical protein IX317_000635 [Fusobacterium sp. DD29]|uniref:major capsid protein n=1 Tax=unclassified Fusobacterium TaxID=2648384 RepID=UPI001B8BAA6D|nr:MULTISPECIES: major capsid protein [unclassified Fusobacterium]MBR8700243.1 hypothetical protein [Fusobacterium sp. DD45]MBR8710502.1 hypothetical protein [Fusobacterium sp. DD28]MBR8748974.1 hypothetical protein [Fusobacterium sp. DD29]MBR8751048.1 hypothetical protein [Fusobacterium sp. DD26]MBR8761280.1 hypothetical protein [Fusobacterium sp. DD25]
MPAVIEFLGVYDQQVIKPTSFIKDMFFATHKAHEKQKFEIEYKKGGQLVAPFVSELIPGTEMIKRSYESRYYKAPKVAPKRTFTGHELFFDKIPGETIYGGYSPEEKKAKLLGESYAEFEDQITRREELMCIDVLYTGKVVVKGEGVEDEINYGKIKEVSVTNKWNTDKATIAADISSTISEIGETTGQKVELIVMDPVAARLFADNEKIQKLLDIRNFEAGKIAPKDLPAGATYVGALAPHNIPIYSYQTQVQILNEDGKTYKVEKKIPEGSVLFAPSKNVLHYGAAVDVTKGIIQAERVPFEDTDSKANTVEVRTESRPLPVPFDIDAIRVLKVK